MNEGLICIFFLLSKGEFLPIPGPRERCCLLKEEGVMNGGKPVREGEGLLSLEVGIGGSKRMALLSK